MNAADRDEIYDLAALLFAVVNDLHPMYANTSRRGRGIGGQMVTRQCNLLDPEGAEVYLVHRAEDVIREYCHRAEAEGIDLPARARALLKPTEGRP